MNSYKVSAGRIFTIKDKRVWHTELGPYEIVYSKGPGAPLKGAIILAISEKIDDEDAIRSLSDLLCDLRRRGVKRTFKEKIFSDIS